MSLMKSNYTYSSLTSKYDNFMLPCCEIKVDGKDILELAHTKLLSLEVTLSIEDTGSSYFFIKEEYNRGNSGFESDLSSILKVGKIIEVYIGYQSTTTLVFKGFIGSLETTFDVEDSMGFEVMAFDARWLMKTDNVPYLFYEKPNYSDIATEILNRYKTFFKINIDATSDQLTEPVIQKENDFEFLKNTVALKTGFEFFIVADEVYLRKKTLESPFYKIDISTGLRHFSRNTKYVNREIEIQGLDLNFTEPISTKVKAKGSQQIEVIPPALSIYPIEDALTNKEVDTIANNLKKNLESSSKTSQIVIIGIPEIVPARYIEVDKLDKSVNDTYYIVEVVHKISDDGYETFIKTKG